MGGLPAPEQPAPTPTDTRKLLRLLLPEYRADKAGARR